MSEKRGIFLIAADPVRSFPPLLGVLRGLEAYQYTVFTLGDIGLGVAQADPSRAERRRHA